MKKIHSTLSIILCLLFLSGCAELFQGKVDMAGISNGTLSGMLSSVNEISELTTPTQLFVSQGRSSTTIDITWSKVDGAVSYRLERAVVSPALDGSYSEPDESLFEVLEQSVYDTSYQDTLISEGSIDETPYEKRYYYRVSAENFRKKYASSPFTPPEYGTLFPKPQNVKADLGESTDQIKVRWQKVANAVSYDIYRTDSASGTGAVKIDTVSADRDEYTNKISPEEQGVEFYYSVYARNRYGALSAQSSLALGYALVAGAPTEPKNVKVTDGRGTSTSGILIEWDAVQAASEVTYHIYRTSSVDASFTLLANQSGTSFTDTKNLKPGLFYYYQIQASIKDEAGVTLKSKFSDSGSESTKPAEGFILSPPSQIAAEKIKNSGDKVLWTAAIGSSEEQQNYKYNIYGDMDINGTYSELVMSVPATPPDESGYISAIVSKNFSYYKIKTCRIDNALESSFSTVTSPSPFAAERAVATQHAKLESEYMVANSSGVYPVKIMWQKPTDDEPSGYHVYRSTTKNSGYRKITEEPITNLYFIDTDDTTKAGKRYYYKVLSVNALGQGTMYSDVTIGYGALTHEQYMREYNKTLKASHKRLSLMHKSNDMDKLGSETVYGAITGSCHYNASIAGLGADITMKYTNYAEFYIDNNPENGIYFTVSGNTDTSANMSANGSMSGTMVCTGMYPGKVYYDAIQIKGGSAGGGTYGIEPEGFARGEVSWTIGEE